MDVCKTYSYENSSTKMLTLDGQTDRILGDQCDSFETDFLKNLGLKISSGSHR